MFTSFLFDKLSHLNQFYKTEEEFIKHLIGGEVTISVPDLIRFQSEYEQSKNKLPSQFQIGDYVSINVGEDFIVRVAQVLNVHFSESKVKYDLSIHMTVDKKFYQTRIYNVDSSMLNKADNVYYRTREIPIQKK